MLDIGWDKKIDSFKEGTKEVAETAHEKTNEFHENYVSKFVPDCGKYGDEAKFVAELVPGVAEYNAIKDGDWQSFAISAGIDVAAIGIGAFTFGSGYVATKGASTGAKAGVKVATRELAEAGVKKGAKELAEAGAKKGIKELAEAGTEKVAKEVAEAGIEKGTKEVAESGAKKAIKEFAEKGVEKTTKETAEKLTTKSIKEVGEKIDKRLIPEYLDEIERITNREIKPDQLEKLQKALKEQDFAKLDNDKSKLHRKLFDNARDKLIDEWEKNTGDKWPVYAEDVLNEHGEVIRKAGQRFDAHHIIESSFGGPNAWWNLHPAAFPAEHQAGIHAIDGLANLIF